MTYLVVVCESGNKLVAFGGRADIEPQAKPAGSVENDEVDDARSGIEVR
jgi:hypothetical protein